MTPVSHRKPCAGNPHARFDEGASAPGESEAECSTPPALREKISEAAQAVLDARASYVGSTLANLYDPLAMPPELVKAHAHLDALVDKAYGLKPSATDSERVALLFKLYAAKVKEKGEA